MEHVTRHDIPIVPLKIRTLSKSLRSCVQLYSWNDEERWLLFYTAVSIKCEKKIKHEILNWDNESVERLVDIFIEIVKYELSFFSITDEIVIRLWGEKWGTLKRAATLAVASAINLNKYIDMFIVKFGEPRDSNTVLFARKRLYIDLISQFKYNFENIYDNN